MDADLLRAPPTLRRFWRTPFQYSLLITAVLFAKLLHLYNHVTSLPVLLYLLYMPTFLALDALNAVVFWGIVHITTHGRLWILLALVRGLFCLMILGASSVQIAFYMETGGEIKWGAAKNLASDPDGFKVALTGGVQAMFVSILIIVVAFVISQPLYNGAQTLFGAAMKAFINHYPRLSALPKEAAIDNLNQEANYASSVSSEDEGQEHCLSTDRTSVEAEPLINKQESRQSNQWAAKLMFVVPITGVCILLYLRPSHFPYAHMSSSLPFTLAEIWNPFDGDMCQAGHFKDFPQFPIEYLVSEEFWEPSNGRYIGWRPNANITVAYQSSHHVPRPSWLPEERIQGFERWYQAPQQPRAQPKESPGEGYIEVTSKGKISHPGHGPPPHSKGFHSGMSPGASNAPWPHHGHGHGRGRGFKGLNYDPVTDPLRISNLDQDVVAPIIEALQKRNIKIKHLVLLALESTRKDVFPFKKDSHLHKIIMKTHGSDSSAAKASAALSKITSNSEIISGEASGFGLYRNYSSAKPGTWRSLSADRGGINVQGAFTGSTTSLKSMLESHCGVQPLAVDFTVEADCNIYQPCIPSILKLFNTNKASHKSDASGLEKNDFSSMTWKSVYVQAITDQFDHQDELNEQVGFNEIIVKNTLLDPESKHFPPTEKQSNYFGFPETQIKPYLIDLFREAEKTGERLFLSHLTSSTHHPWNLPEAAGESVEYLKQGRWRKEHELNRYLNTIKYIDNWIGEVMDLLEDTGVAEQTLVIMVGDHGMAFEEDSPVHSTFENGHISNMRVPLNFYHPSLPRMQLQINATSLSIIPTILDLLVTTSSLNQNDSNIASDLIQQYEGQSLIRPYQVEKNGRQAWNIAILNAGGAVLSVSSAAVPFRLIIPICKAGVYRFTSNDLDPNELHPVEANSVSELARRVKFEYDDDVAEWVELAEKIGKWWVLEQRRRWRYNGASLQDDRTPEELRGAGAEKKDHWWDT